MNLPVILDIAIGLIFIYLILSLLASEIQELLSTLLQWRAEHLKKSIEILLAGGCNTPEEKQVIELANSLYNNPLIKNINQEAKGLIVTLPRKLTWLISSICRYCMKMIPVNTREQSVFGKITNNTDNTNNEKQRHSGPSYMDSQTFATTLLETLKFPTVSHRITISKLKEFKDERLVKEMQAILNTLNANLSADESRNSETESVYPKIDRKFANLKKQFDKIVNDFENNKGSLITSLDRIQEKLDLFITDIKDDFSAENLNIGKNFHRNLTSLKKDIFGSDPKTNQAEKLVLLGGLKPSLNEIVQTYKIYRETKAQIKESQETNSPVDRKIQEIFQDIQAEIDKLPNSVLDSLEVLAIRAQAKVKSTEEDLNQLRQEIEVWFDRSMERAGGVYKRNAKGVAIMIGCLIAIAANADTLYIVDRLSRDSVIRQAISESASNIASINDISNVRGQIEKALQGISLPIGWNLQQSQAQTSTNHIFQTLQKLFGWLLSGIAIAMGAPFWFDLLNRVVNVRNAGKRPHSSANSATTSDD